jgi:hypothetical protein
MTTNGGMQIAVFLALILAITKPLGVFMARVFSRERTFLDPVARPSLLPCRRRWPFTPPRLSRPTPIGRTIQASRPGVISRKWPASLTNSPKVSFTARPTLFR